METEKSKIPIGVLITILPFIGYLFAFVYEYGYAKHFNIPYDIISIKIETILLLTFIVLSVFLIFYFLFDNYFPLLSRWFNKGSVHQFIIIRMFILFMILLAFGLSVIDPIWLFAVLIYTIITIIFPLISPLLRKDKTITYTQQFEKKRNVALSETTFTDVLVGKFGFKVILLMISIILLSLFVEMIGGYVARNTTNFYTINGDSTFVLVRTYGDKLILAEPKQINEGNIKQLKIENSSLIKEYILLPYQISKEHTISKTKSEAENRDSGEITDSLDNF